MTTAQLKLKFRGWIFEAWMIWRIVRLLVYHLRYSHSRRRMLLQALQSGIVPMPPPAPAGLPASAPIVTISRTGVLSADDLPSAHHIDLVAHSVLVDVDRSKRLSELVAWFKAKHLLGSAMTVDDAVFPIVVGLPGTVKMRLRYLGAGPIRHLAVIDQLKHRGQRLALPEELLEMSIQNLTNLPPGRIISLGESGRPSVYLFKGQGVLNLVIHPVTLWESACWFAVVED